MSMNELQRIGRILGVKADVDDKTMCLIIQDKIKKKDSEIGKKKFLNEYLKVQVDNLKREIHNLQSEYAESIGIHEHMMVKQSRDNYKKDNNKLLMENYNLRKSIEQYRENELKDKLKKIEGVI